MSFLSAPPSLGIFSAGGDSKYVKEKLSHAIKQIETQRKDLEVLRKRIDDRRVQMFNHVVKAIEKSDDMRAQVFTGEHLELQKIARVVSAAELALAQIIVRLETIRDMGDITYALTNAFNEVKKIGKSIQEVAPSLEASAREINESFTNLLAELGILSPSATIELSDEPSGIVEKAHNLVKERTIELSDLPKAIEELKDQNGIAILEGTKRIALLATGEPETEERVKQEEEDFLPMLLVDRKSESASPLELSRIEVAKVDPELAIKSYLREKGLEKLDVAECSAQLNLPVDLVEQAYMKLLAKNTNSASKKSI